MNPQEAIKVISEVCANFQGTLAQHQTIQAALKTLENLAIQQNISLKKTEKK